MSRLCRQFYREKLIIVMLKKLLPRYDQSRVGKTVPSTLHVLCSVGVRGIVSLVRKSISASPNIVIDRGDGQTVEEGEQ